MLFSVLHKVLVYIEYKCTPVYVRPLVGIGTPSPPHPKASVPLAEPKGGWDTPAGEGVPITTTGEKA